MAQYRVDHYAVDARNLRSKGRGHQKCCYYSFNLRTLRNSKVFNGIF